MLERAVRGVGAFKGTPSSITVDEDDLSREVPCRPLKRRAHEAHGPALLDPAARRVLAIPAWRAQSERAFPGAYPIRDQQAKLPRHGRREAPAFPL